LVLIEEVKQLFGGVLDVPADPAEHAVSGQMATVLTKEPDREGGEFGLYPCTNVLLV